MLLATHTLTIAVALTIAPYFPNPLDTDGWGLRVRGPSTHGPYLAGERIDQMTLEVLLINFTKLTREYVPLEAARGQTDFDIDVIPPAGQRIPSQRHPSPRNRFTEQVRLRPGCYALAEFCFAEFGYSHLRASGQYRLEATLKIGGKKLSAPPVELVVVEPPADAILVTHTLPLAGRHAAQPVNEQYRAVVQQVRVKDRVWLVYRKLYGPKFGGGAALTARLAELPGKVDMTVAGSFAELIPNTSSYKPFTVAYKHPEKGQTTLTVNPIDGSLEPSGGHPRPPAPDPKADRTAPAPRPGRP